MYVPQNRSSAEQALNHPFVTRAYKQEVVSRISVPDPNYISPKGEIIPSMTIAPVPANLPANDTAYLTSVNMSGMNDASIPRKLTHDNLGTAFDDINVEELQEDGLIPRVDPGTNRAPKKAMNKTKNNNTNVNVNDRGKIDKKENIMKTKTTYVQEDILAADNTNTTASLPCSGKTDAGVDSQSQVDALQCDSGSQPHPTASNTNTGSGSRSYQDKLQVQVDVTSTATSSSAATAAASVSSSVHGESSSDVPRMHQQNIPQAQVEEHSLTNVKTRESKRKLSAVQYSSISTQDNATLHNKRNCKKKAIGDKSKEKEKGKEIVTATTSIGDKPTHSKAKMRLNDNITATAAAATSHTDVTKKSNTSTQNKRNGAFKYTEVTGEKIAGEKEKEKGGGGRGGGRGEKGVSRDHFADTVTDINTTKNTDVNVISELDMKKEGVALGGIGVGTGVGVGAGVIESRRHSKRERSDTKHTQQQLQQQQLQQQQHQQQLQHQMIVCGGDAESSFLSQEDSNTTVETASQGSCDWCVRTHVHSFSLSHSLTLSLSRTHMHSLSIYLALIFFTIRLSICVFNLMMHYVRGFAYVLSISS